MKSVKISLVLVSLSLLVTQLQVSAAEYRADPYLTKQFTLSGSGQLEVETSGSSVSVTGGSNKEVVVDMFVKLNGREISSEDPAVEKELENYDLNISQSGNTISLIVKRKMNSGRSKLNLSFKIKAPKEMSSKFQSSGGSIAIDGLNGTQEVATSGGSIQVLNSSGMVDTRSSGGSFRLENFEGDVEVQTSGGSIKVNGLTGDIRVGSSGGSVNLEEINGRIDVNTSGGSIRAQLSDLEKELTMKSSGGSITAIVPKGLGLDLDLSGGRVNSSFSNFDGEIKKDRVLGKINGGGIPVTMQSSGGSINLEFN
ncbi:DUF4097 family beta strand repeat protein [Algoriphagus aestuariicola]|uniref:DUF4097 family beta strand repeat protein n=1 Tax=Algoriphagus aestuariicola TaxID=1852016 RepID=A0ABS3BMQ9_9BACT|nr:DUF4097 family beta strand repeat-containing protein [Algoriphagus aestuariicola]MBN7800330.1 DUF4097 family beta strand repeat protein [Algoriphagus aestuariicola]